MQGMEKNLYALFLWIHTVESYPIYPIDWS